MTSSRKYPPLKTISEIRRWCDRRERAHGEVYKKLSDWGVWGDEADGIVAELISENYLNEARYASAFARGKYRMNKWGRKKIEMVLRGKGVSKLNISNALTEIDSDEYRENMRNLIQKKQKQLSDEDSWTTRQKLLRYLVSKGYSIDEILEEIDADNS